MRARRAAVAAALALVLPWEARAVPASSSPPRLARPLAVVDLDGVDGAMVVLVDGRRIEVRVVPRAGEGYGELAKRLLGSSGLAAELRRANGGRETERGVALVVPWRLMRPAWRVKAMAAFFPEDRPVPEGIQHRVRFRTDGERGETPGAIATWLAGKAESGSRLVVPKGRKGKLLPGDVVLVPASMLAPEFRELLPRAAPPEERAGEKEAASRKKKREAPPPAEPDLVSETVPAGEPTGMDDENGRGVGAAEAEEERPDAEAIAREAPFEFEDDATSQKAFAFAGGGPLEYRKDDAGPYAAYYLKPGEALYSAVVGRFTGRVDADEVNQLAELIAVRSRIDDVTDIPIGARIKVPLELLLPEWLPPGHPDRVAYEAGRSETDLVKAPPRTRELSGVVVVLDSGHGGEDVGAMANGAWESDYVYDIVMRIKRLLEKDTAAQVIPTMKDREHGHAVFDARELPRNKAEEIQTSPPYRPVLGQPGVHFRWYLSNYYFRQLTRKGHRPEYVVFTSVHADSLHPSMRGAMVYVPGRDYRTLKFSRASGIYGDRKEVKAVPVVSFTGKELVRSEGLSRQLASQVITAFADGGLPVHRATAIRDHVVRKGKSWVPAVIKYAQVPTAILLEVCNLNNPEDARNIRDPKFRERVARAYVNALRAYYGEAQRPKAVEASRLR